MKVSHLLGLGMLALGLLLLQKSQRGSRKGHHFNGIVFQPTAIFIWQSSSKRPKIKILND